MSTALPPFAHWSFQNGLSNETSLDLATLVHGVRHIPVSHPKFSHAAYFNGSAHLEIPHHPELNFGSDDFSVALWLETDGKSDLVGDLLSKFNYRERCGWTLNVVTNSGVTTTTQSNFRHLHFGIDQGRQAQELRFCGRPGESIFIVALATIEGHLYAGTFEQQADQAGHLWRYLGNSQWEDLGTPPDGANTITSIACLNGVLHVSSGRYYATGSCLEPTLNSRPGGHVYRITEDGEWIDCGNPGLSGASPEQEFTGYEAGHTDLADETSSLTVFQGHLYATSYHRSTGVYRYCGGTTWECLNLPERVMSMAVYRDALYVLVNHGRVYRYDGGTTWTNLGVPDRSTQNYGVAVHRGKLHVGTWPECEVFTWEGEQQWKNLGRVGYEREVMAMNLYNSKVYHGTLPMANLWRQDEETFSYIGNADNTPVRLRRLWSMAVYDGKLFMGTLPAGHVVSYEAGKMATADRILPAGWHHVAAIRQQGELSLWLDGKPVARSSSFAPDDFNLNNREPLLIGFGSHDFLRGNIADLRLYKRALTEQEITVLSNTSCHQSFESHDR